ncbi:MAG: glutamate-5-semialdehyde dehydrogenase [Treponema sp.]|uniref:glutamate-5-semialdehyde dehydrogenase n=1 Tax=Treponema sp. TaxID=166 RepID=UPI0025CFFECE|nr:glutamate-5-semialdehyde dehydrogenase [Treponema sp.]MBQ8679456.1 glutamate-5-semialdehyde dehydrogenase [Treponema sp.]
MNINEICDSLRAGSDTLALQTAAQKNVALEAVISSIEKNRPAILAANAEDVALARSKGTSEALVDRLSLNDKRIDGLIDSIKIIISQTDPIGEETAGWKTPKGMSIRQVRVPLGVVAIIYESRPNVTVDAFALAYKSGNAILLRGSSSALKSNKAIVAAIKEGLSSEAAQGFGVPGAIELAPCESHEEVEEILTAVGKIDVALPRGSAKLINMVVQTAKVPVIETGAGVCHLYVDESGDLEMAENIAWNAKTQRPGVCNAIECILVHEKAAKEFLPRLAKRFAGKVEIRADEKAFEICENLCKSVDCKILKAEESDFGFEFLDLICAVKVVSDVNEAISYINSHNTKHSESIITESRENARLFQAKIDAACVYVNCSTRFTDGGEFGFGAELGISTQKLHARGPMGIKALTTTKYLIDGDGQVR